MIATSGQFITADHCPTAAAPVGEFDTSMARGSEVVALPAASRARAVTEWAPSATARESQMNENGASVSSAPTAAPSTRNCTPETPTLSDASADSVTIAQTVAPLAGAVTVTDGGAVSALLTMTLIEVETPRLPASSSAMAMSSWAPSEAAVVSQSTV